MKKMILALLVALALALGFPASASADNCRTQTMDNGNLTYIYCNGYYPDGTPYYTVTICNQSGCHTRDA